MGLATGLMMGGMAAMKAIGAAKQSSAAKKAATEQQKATDQATGYLREGMGQMAGLYSPYVNAGQSVRGTLSRLTTAPPGAQFAAPPPPNVTPQMQEPGGQAMPRAGMNRTPQPPGGGMSGLFGGMGPPPQGPPGGGQMVQLRSPDGQVMAVPAAKAQGFIQRGAVPVQ
jgi:hypothetical protein